jgi:hypothetical protein
MVDWLEIKLIKYGYSGRMSDLIKYSGSLDALIWYWENFLEKIIVNSKGFYGGAFIRFKIKAEAKKKYNRYKEELSQKEKNKISEQKIAKERLNNIEILEEKLDGWFTEYSSKDKSCQKNDLEKYIWESGNFDFNPEYKKKELLASIKTPCNLKALHRILFKEFMDEIKEHLSVKFD